MSKNPEEYKKDISSAKFTISRQVSPDSLLGVSVGMCQRALVDQSGMIIIQISVDQKMVAVRGTLRMIPPRNSNHYIKL
jgi:hypothetical protein